MIMVNGQSGAKYGPEITKRRDAIGGVTTLTTLVEWQGQVLC